MDKRAILVLTLLISVFPVSRVLANAVGPAITLQAKELVEKASRYDGQVVEIAGEAIGDLMQRDGEAWVNILDGSYAIGVRLEPAQARAIRTLGGYRVVGDQVKVRGTFHRACPAHGGDLDIHADTVEITRPGTSVPDPIDPRKAALALFWVLCAAALMLIYYRPWRPKPPKTVAP
ncbi:MAG TPA: DNA-binding protein [Firmicutes bacterium]|nr:DNA-binding protein [Bacillota bacterium]